MSGASSSSVGIVDLAGVYDDHVARVYGFFAYALSSRADAEESFVEIEPQSPARRRLGQQHFLRPGAQDQLDQRGDEPGLSHRLGQQGQEPAGTAQSGSERQRTRSREAWPSVPKASPRVDASASCRATLGAAICRLPGRSVLYVPHIAQTPVGSTGRIGPPRSQYDRNLPIVTRARVACV